MTVFVLTDKIQFPPPHLATREGLLAIGGDLGRRRLLHAYRMGIFPWYAEGEPILWWSPDPRLVLYPRRLRLSASLRKRIRQRRFTLSADRSFGEVIQACARIPRRHQDGTWIVPEMIAAYRGLHEAGLAHSVEAWQDGRLAGGLYGVSLGRCFYGESMFSRQTDASKVALAGLVQFLERLDFELIDCQVPTGHLMRLGAEEVPRKRFLKELRQALKKPTLQGSWSAAFDRLSAEGPLPCADWPPCP